MPPESVSSRSSAEREPALEAVDQQIQDAKRATLRVLSAPTWTCSDGHEHPRPEWFTHRRLQQEVRRKNAHEPWTSSVESLAVYALIHDGTLERRQDWQLRRVAV